jgi:hypothetical protein
MPPSILVLAISMRVHAIPVECSLPVSNLSAEFNPQWHILSLIIVSTFICCLVVSIFSILSPYDSKTPHSAFGLETISSSAASECRRAANMRVSGMCNMMPAVVATCRTSNGNFRPERTSVCLAGCGKTPALGQVLRRARLCRAV